MIARTDSPTLETDYLVVGAGALAMAFVDTLLDESDANIVMVDRNAHPGGHWNQAYPFVRLHLPTAWYGVPSREVVESTPDPDGFERGATGADVLSYFGALMRERFLPSRRVVYMPRYEYTRDADGTHRVTSLESGASRTIKVRRKLVDATLSNTEIPATTPPRYTVEPGVACIAPNMLPDVARSYSRYTVVGAGKTGMDTCLWLLQNGVDQSRIRWIRPREPWLQDRANMRFGEAHFERSMRSVIDQFDAIAEASSVNDLFLRLEQRGIMTRIDPSVEPTSYRCAIVSQAELVAMRRIEDVVRLGHVQSIGSAQTALEQGTIATHHGTLYINCTAGGVQPLPARRVFDGDTVNVLSVIWCRPMFSASAIACVECHVESEAEKNAMCTPVPTPERPADLIRMMGATFANMARWSQHAETSRWLKSCRLHATRLLLRGIDAADPRRTALLAQNSGKAAMAAGRIRELMAAGAH